MSRHALSMRAIEEIKIMALVATLISMHGFKLLKCLVNPDVLLMDHFLYRLSMFLEKLKKIFVVKV